MNWFKKNLNHDPDEVATSGKTIYDVGYGEIFWRNFVAGVGRGIGHFFFSLIIVVIIANLFFVYLWPMIEPFLSSFTALNNILLDLQGNYQNSQQLFKPTTPLAPVQ